MSRKQHAGIFDPSFLSSIQVILWNAASQLHHELWLRDSARLADLDLDGLARDTTAFYEDVFAPGPADGTPTDRLARRLGAVCRAMNLLAEGRYGHCDACRATLDEERLQLRPYLLCCPNCEEALRFRFAALHAGQALETC